MPGDVTWCDSSSRSPDYQSQKQCKKTSFAFYQAVRDRLPSWALEDMRTMEALHWEEGGKVSAYSPSEALLYALVHDHQPYAHYLLSHFPQEALAMPSKNFSCCQSSAPPHLTMAVRYDRVAILRGILTALRGFPAGSRDGYINRRGCNHVEGGKSAVHLACELQRAQCLMLLLGQRASPYVTDGSGDTPLDSLLQLLGGSSQHQARRALLLLCLDSLLLYMPGGIPAKARQRLLGDKGRWQGVLGPGLYRWLSGTAPATLFTRSMQSLLGSLPPERFPEALGELPLPDFLTPPALRWNS
ncbi:hypothetical protein FKM82_016924 [Ascaphus truei]